MMPIQSHLLKWNGKSICQPVNVDNLYMVYTSQTERVPFLPGKHSNPELATHVLQFIFISDSGFRFPVAQWPSGNCTPSDLYHLFWEGVPNKLDHSGVDCGPAIVNQDCEENHFCQIRSCNGHYDNQTFLQPQSTQNSIRLGQTTISPKSNASCHSSKNETRLSIGGSQWDNHSFSVTACLLSYNYEGIVIIPRTLLIPLSHLLLLWVIASQG